MRYFHNSQFASLKLRSESRAHSQGSKPSGFWFDVDGSWLCWLLGEGYEHDPSWLKPYWYEIVPTPEVRLLRIESYAALTEFTEAYSVPIEKARGARNEASIDWPRLSEEFDGIVISPYQWKARHELLWYYGWDVASGCVWRNADRLETKRTVLEEVRELARARE